MMNANNEEDHRQQAANAARATRAINRAAAIAAAEDVDVAADFDAVARVARLDHVDAVDAVDVVDAVAAAADASVAPATSFLDLLVHIRVDILNWLGPQTPDELRNLTLVSKQVYKDCKQPGIEWHVSSVEIKPRPLQGGSTFALMQQLRNHYHIMGNDNTRRFDHMKVIDAYKFDLMELIDIPNYFKLGSISSLHMSISFSMAYDEHLYQAPMPIVSALSKILPNLREINLSNVSTGTDVLSNVSRRCPYLEKVTWNNSYNDKFVRLNGWSMGFAKNLKVIIMDDSEFDETDYNDEDPDDWEDEEMLLSDLDNHRNKFLFYHCSNALERVSIRNATFNGLFEQNILIKFVRNVPTLRWFRSDLTEENMNMLRLERPDIEFLN